MKMENVFKTKVQIDPMITYEGITKYIPLLICGGFYLITVLLFIFGPFNWNISNDVQLYSFLFLAFIALVIGYVVGVKIKREKRTSNFNIDKILYVTFSIFIVMYVLNTYATTGRLLPDVIGGLMNSGNAYDVSHNISTGFSRMIIYLGILIAPITSFLTPLFFIYFKNISLLNKILGIIVLLLNLSTGIAQGVINAYAIIAFQIIMMLVIYLFSNFKEKSLKQILVIITIIICIGLSFILYYKTVMGNRLISDAQGLVNTETPIGTEHVENTEDTESTEIVENTEDTESTEIVENTETQTESHGTNQNQNVSVEVQNDVMNGSAEMIAQAQLKPVHLYSFLPDSLESTINHIVSYITHGYKGLSFAMQKDFTSSYGLGFSDFFRHNLLKVFGKVEFENDLYSRTYMKKIEADGWATGYVWSSFFIYPASDIGFPLTILLVGIIGFIFSLSWRDALESKNIFAAVIFLTLCMMICFFCANNSYLQTGGPFLSFCFIGACWVVSRFLKKGK